MVSLFTTAATRPASTCIAADVIAEAFAVLEASVVVVDCRGVDFAFSHNAADVGRGLVLGRLSGQGKGGMG